MQRLRRVVSLVLVVSLILSMFSGANSASRAFIHRVFAEELPEGTQQASSSVILDDEDFEGIDDWTTSGNVSQSNEYFNSGQYSIELSENGSIEKTISTQGCADITVSFYAFGQSISDSGINKISYFNGSEWNELMAVGSGFNSDAFNLYSIEIPEQLNTDSIAVRFEIADDVESSLYIDDLVVESPNGTMIIEAPSIVGVSVVDETLLVEWNSVSEATDYPSSLG